MLEVYNKIVVQDNLTGNLSLKVVPTSGIEVKLTMPFRYVSPNSFIA